MSNDNFYWKPGASINALKARAKLLSKVRSFFKERSVLEVETPLLSSSADNDPQINLFSLSKINNTDNSKLYLQPSPELFMKRLLASGSGSIFQISKAFRNHENGKFHNSEFSILEWYRVNFSSDELIEEIAALIRIILETPDLEVIKKKYADVFLEYLDLHIVDMDSKDLENFVVEMTEIDNISGKMEKDDWLDLLMGNLIIPMLGLDHLVFITDYPASQSALAKINKKNKNEAHRFELFYRGYELANGFEELTNHSEQRERFHQNNMKRRDRAQEELIIDNKFLSALDYGLPECSGVAVGLDRVLMCLLETNDIDEVLSFSFKRI